MENNNTNFETQFSELLIEYLLYKRDRNPDKTWGHIWGWTTVFSYCRWNSRVFEIFLPEKYKQKNTFFHFEISTKISDFSKEELYFIEKYHLLDEEHIFSVIPDVADKEIYPFIYTILSWYHGNFEKKLIKDSAFKGNYLFNFMYSISSYEHKEHSYYFHFSEMIFDEDVVFLLLSYKQNPQYLFSSIALASYYFHKGNLPYALGFYKKALELDPENPWIGGKLSSLYLALPGNDNAKKAEDIMEKVRKDLPDAPWVYTYSGEVSNALQKYSDTVKYVEHFELLTEGKHRTFEPYMRRAQALIGIGDFKRARKDLNKISEYYFGEGYRFMYDEIHLLLKRKGY